MLNLFIFYFGEEIDLTSRERDEEETGCYNDFPGIKTVSLVLLLLSLLCYYYYYIISYCLILYYILFYLFHFISKLSGEKKTILDNMYNTCKQQ